MAGHFHFVAGKELRLPLHEEKTCKKAPQQR